MSVCVITRAQPGAQITGERIAELGHTPLIVPAADVRPTGASIVTQGVQALLMTSAAAARNALMEEAVLDLPVYAVGDSTAAAAREAGFSEVISAGGDGANLAVLAADRMKPSDGALLHIRGSEIAGDVLGMLTACGFETRFVEVYQTLDNPDFKGKITKIVQSDIGIVILHSPAGARRLVQALYGKSFDLGQWTAVGLSQACLSGLDNMGFCDLVFAEQPDELALIETIAALATQSST